jgi:hypothetical protein
MKVFVFCMIALFISTGAQAHKLHHKYHRHHIQHTAPHGYPSDMITVPTAAGISITVNPSFAQKIVPFIAELVAEGYKPRHIGCFASGGHVPNSRHYAGAACDFDQTGWGRTSSKMYHVTALASKYGLRDGKSFGDSGHIDDGAPVSSYASRSYRHSHYGG